MSFTRQKEHCLSVATDSLNCAEADKDFFKIAVTGDETWVYIYDPETKQPSSQWKTLSPPPKKCTKFEAKEG
jgi:hypothetical protein